MLSFAEKSLFQKRNQIVQHVSREIEKKKNNGFMYAKTHPKSLEGHRLENKTMENVY